MISKTVSVLSVQQPLGRFPYGNKNIGTNLRKNKRERDILPGFEIFLPTTEVNEELILHQLFLALRNY